MPDTQAPRLMETSFNPIAYISLPQVPDRVSRSEAHPSLQFRNFVSEADAPRLLSFLVRVSTPGLDGGSFHRILVDIGNVNLIQKRRTVKQAYACLLTCRARRQYLSASSWRCTSSHVQRKTACFR